jgi:uncharacterized surface protein with fasciclin (FAS1) repeats
VSGRLIGAVAAGLLGLAACSPTDRGAKAEKTGTDVTSGTVAAALGEVDNHRKLSAALADTQLAPVLDGKGDYTLLAPSDAAFEALGEKGKALSAKDQRPLMIAVLRGHILPGQVTPHSVEQAIERKKGPVEMRTMAGDTVRFAKTEKGLTVSNGAQTAVLEAGDLTTPNGAVLPIDTVLLPAN